MSDQIIQLVESANLNVTGDISELISSTKFNDVVPVDKKNVTEESELQEFLTALTLVMSDDKSSFFSKDVTSRIKLKIDELVDAQINEIIQNKDFKYLESIWLSLRDIFHEAADEKDIEICLLELTKEELLDDFELNSADFTGSNLFKRIYRDEYDQYGGEPYALSVGMFDIQNTYDDFFVLSNLGKIAGSAHTPFISNIGPEFFGYSSFEEFDEVKDLEGLLEGSKFKMWNQFRKTEESAYVGMTFPRYLIRRPYDDSSTELYGSRNQYSVSFFREKLNNPFDQKSYVWGFSSGLLARNIITSFKKTGWCQYIRGPLGGGLIEDIPTYQFEIGNYKQKTGSVEYFISDSQEYAFSKAGLIPFVGDKRGEGGCFFSVQSAKFVPDNLENLDLMESIQANSNLSYTLSVSRVAHYVKSMVRDRIGSNYDQEKVQTFLSDWLNGFVTIASNPSDVTLAYFPFKEASVKVEPQPGKLGWYGCSIDLVPHIQLEGIDVSLRLATKLPIGEGSDEAESDSE
ncbi:MULTISPECIES: type VI secretion system contractile sheath large subunit [Cysteiniphilum]|uniref:type VI secretion system contractile sheath large subunit n=1 Tax=Cysteiniphilum TaxID=2056696 RepID=UPI001783B60C|nr:MULTISPECIES: type VI secretion system contractile sheath large subunit [Cysteiniphilum]